MDFHDNRELRIPRKHLRKPKAPERSLDQDLGIKSRDQHTRTDGELKIEEGCFSNDIGKRLMRSAAGKDVIDLLNNVVRKTIGECFFRRKTDRSTVHAGCGLKTKQRLCFRVVDSGAGKKRCLLFQIFLDGHQMSSFAFSGMTACTEAIATSIMLSVGSLVVSFWSARPGAMKILQNAFWSWRPQKRRIS